MKKSHHVFAGADYYPCGGVKDLVFSGTYIECIDFLIDHPYYDWYQIVNSDLKIIKEK